MSCSPGVSMPKTPTISFVSLGCSKNLVDSERMLGLLAQDGYAHRARLRAGRSGDHQYLRIHRLRASGIDRRDRGDAGAEAVGRMSRA